MTTIKLSAIMLLAISSSSLLAQPSSTQRPLDDGGAPAASTPASNDQRWATSEGTMRLPRVPRNGMLVSTSYSQDSGRIYGVLSQDPSGRWILNGEWEEASSARDCGGPGRYAKKPSWGNIRFVFNTQFTKFEGSWGYCIDSPSSKWSGSSNPSSIAPKPLDSPSTFGNDIGPGRDTTSDPILSPDEERIREYLDPPIIGVSDEYGPPEDPKKSRHRGMKDIEPPILKLENKESDLPVHSVRNELGFQQDLIDQIAKLGSGNSKPTGAFYNRVFRKLYGEREALIRSASTETNAKVKSVQLEQALELSSTLDSVQPPSSARDNEFRSWNPVYEAMNGWNESSVGRDIASANKIINRPDRDAAFRELDRLREKQRIGEKSQKQRDAVRTDFFNTKVFDKVHSEYERVKYEREIGRHDLQYQKLVNYINDYEKALARKWPTAPRKSKAAVKKTKVGELEVPEIGPLPKVIGAPQAPGPIDFP